MKSECDPSFAHSVSSLVTHPTVGQQMGATVAGSLSQAGAQVAADSAAAGMSHSRTTDMSPMQGVLDSGSVVMVPAEYLQRLAPPFSKSKSLSAKSHFKKWIKSKRRSDEMRAQKLSESVPMLNECYESSGAERRRAARIHLEEGSDSSDELDPYYHYHSSSASTDAAASSSALRHTQHSSVASNGTGYGWRSRHGSHVPAKGCVGNGRVDGSNMEEVTHYKWVLLCLMCALLFVLSASLISFYIFLLKEHRLVRHWHGAGQRLDAFPYPSAWQFVRCVVVPLLLWTVNDCIVLAVMRKCASRLRHVRVGAVVRSGARRGQHFQFPFDESCICETPYTRMRKLIAVNSRVITTATLFGLAVYSYSTVSVFYSHNSNDYAAIHSLLKENSRSRDIYSLWRTLHCSNDFIRISALILFPVCVNLVLATTYALMFYRVQKNRYVSYYDYYNDDTIMEATASLKRSGVVHGTAALTQKRISVQMDDAMLRRPMDDGAFEDSRKNAVFHEMLTESLNETAAIDEETHEWTDSGLPQMYAPKTSDSGKAAELLSPIISPLFGALKPGMAVSPILEAEMSATTPSASHSLKEEELDTDSGNDTLAESSAASTGLLSGKQKTQSVTERLRKSIGSIADVLSPMIPSSAKPKASKCEAEDSPPHLSATAVWELSAEYMGLEPRFLERQYSHQFVVATRQKAKMKYVRLWDKHKALKLEYKTKAALFGALQTEGKTQGFRIEQLESRVRMLEDGLDARERELRDKSDELERAQFLLKLADETKGHSATDAFFDDIANEYTEF